MIEPKPVSGISGQAIWSNQMREFDRRNKLLPGPGYRIRRYPDGIVIEFIETPGGAAPAPETGIAFYTFQSHGLKGPPDLTDYIICQPLGGGANVNILKPPLLRFSLHAHGNITYDNWDPVAQTRFAHGGGVVVTQTITPMYVKGDIIYGFTVGGAIYELPGERTFAGP